MTTKTKTCATCGSDKPLSEFLKNSYQEDGLSNYCKKCTTGKRQRYNRKLANVPTDPELNPKNLEEFIARQKRLAVIEQRISTITMAIGRHTGTLKRKTSKEVNAKAAADKERLIAERAELNLEVQVYKESKDVPQTFYMPAIVDEQFTVHTFRKLKTLKSACMQRNSRVDSLIEGGLLSPSNRQTTRVEVADFQITVSQKTVNKKLARINTRTKS